ncbi:MAG: lamin tail domain-containing protein [Verrucomicrobiaceae bacterium]|nr:MAG: lamin tail domain-containing protein [Verrucomicrobiaceae bacterium]
MGGAVAFLMLTVSKFSTMRLFLPCFVTWIAFLCCASADVFISEFDATNTGTARDADGETRDWIEIYNSGATSVSLEGWALSDEPESPANGSFPPSASSPTSIFSSLLLKRTGRHREYNCTRTSGFLPPGLSS